MGPTWGTGSQTLDAARTRAAWQPSSWSRLHVPSADSLRLADPMAGDAENCVSKDVVEAAYVLKTCVAAGGQAVQGVHRHVYQCLPRTPSADPTGQTDCATTCFEDFVKKQDGDRGRG